MNKKSNEIDCLDRLQALAHQFSEVLAFLVEEKVVTKDSVDGLLKQGLSGKTLQQMLSDLKATDKLQLCEYTWTILPVERITLLIVTDRNQREFTYDGV